MVLVKKYLIIVISAMFVISAAVALSATQARAYPTGWTSDSQVPGVTYGMLDIATRGPFVHLLRKNGAGRIEYCRSADYGATWGTPVVVDLNGSHEDYCPQIETNGGNGVFIAYKTKDAWVTGPWSIAVRHSSDAGTTWDSGYYGYTSENRGHDYPELGRSADGSVFLIYQTMSGPTSGPWDVFFRQIIEGGLGTERSVSTGDGSDSTHPCIECEGTDTFWVAYVNGGNIKARKYIASTGWAGAATTLNQNLGAADWPDVAVTGPGDKIFVWAEGVRVWGRTYHGMYWQDPEQLYSSAVSPWPDISNVSGIIGCDDALSVSNTTTTIMTLTTNPYNTPHSIATDSNGTNSYVAVTQTDGVTYLKRTDAVAPTGTMKVNGQQANGQMKYTRSTFPVDLENVVDDWNLTGVTPSGDHFTNGVSTADIQVSVNGSTWSTVESLTDAPWSCQVILGHMTGNLRYIRAQLTDTAGNVGTVSYDTLYVNDDGPRTNIGISPRANSAGWNNTVPTVTLASDSPAYDYSEYFVSPAGVGGGVKAETANWTRYAAGFKLPEGRWTVTAHSKDRVGNYGPEKTLNVYVDKTRPVCAIMRPSKGVIQTGYDSNDAFRVTGTGTDANGLTWAAIYIDNGSKPVAQTRSAFNMAYTWKLAGVTDGIHSIIVKATDPAGNVGIISKQVTLGVVANDWYFAEGNTLPEMDEWLCVLNPGDQPAKYQITFMLEDGTTKTVERSMSSHQRDTVKVKDYITEVHTGVSVHIHTDNHAVVAERPMYFVYKQGVPGFNWKGGHDVMGINTLQKDWYFAEGTTRMNDADGNRFNEWVTLQNADQSATANVKITYMLGTGQNIDKLYQVGPHSRCTVEVAQDIGINQDVSMAVNSDIPIAAERPMYFNYHRYATDGSNVVGALSPDTQWAFSEGCTQPGYQQWLTIQNPNGVPATCEIKYFTGEGKVNAVKRTVNPKSRDTVNVLSHVGSNQEVSTILTSNVPVIAERPMYYVYGAGNPARGWSGGDSTLGNPAPSTEYFLAEGTTISNFDTYYTLMNPDASRGCHVTIDYIFGDGTTQSVDYLIKPHARMTINVREAIKKEANVSGSIIADLPIVIERPMYFNYDNRGLTGGHDVQGYGTD